MATIDSVSDEILLYIFRIHVWRNQDTPYRLLRVSKRWNGVTTGNGSLWGNIAFAELGGSTEMAHRNKIICPTPQSLMLAIERTGTSPFELTLELYKKSSIGLNGFNTIEAAISQRCRALTFELTENASMMRNITSLTALERLSFSVVMEASDDMKHLLSVVTHTAKKLQRLDVDNGQSILPYSGFISRSKSVQFYSFNSIGPEGKIISEAPNLEQLCLSARQEGRLVQLNATLPALQRLGISYPDFANIPWERYTRLTHLWLSIDEDKSFPLSPTRTFTFPTLYHLMINGSWGVLSCIKAPVLESLVLQDHQKDHAQAFSAIEATSLQPRSLDIDIDIGGNSIIQILRGKWRNIEILRLLANENGIGESLTDCFTNDPSFCANMLELMVHCSVLGVENVRLELTKIADARSQGTGGVLKRVRHNTAYYSGEANPLPFRGSVEEYMGWESVMADEAYSTPSFWHGDSCYHGCHREFKA